VWTKGGEIQAEVDVLNESLNSVKVLSKKSSDRQGESFLAADKLTGTRSRKGFLSRTSGRPEDYRGIVGIIQCKELITHACKCRDGDGRTNINLGREQDFPEIIEI